MVRPTPNNNEVIVKTTDMVVSKADEAGNIEYANPIFYKLSEYSKRELNFAPHSILRHPDMPKIIFKLLWNGIESGDRVYAFVKNLTKSGSFYWVFATVRPALNPDNSFRNYVSVRKSMSLKAREIIEPLYQNLLTLEKNSGIEASESALRDFLNGRDFNEVMLDIQNS